MKSKAFTLIEILVVLVVIGALAGLALPRYLTVVERTRAAEGVGILRKLLEAQKVYRLDNGSYATSASQLALDIETYGASKAYKMENFNWEGRYTGTMAEVSSGEKLSCLNRVNMKSGGGCLYSLCIDQDSNIECNNASCNVFSCSRLGTFTY